MIVAALTLAVAAFIAVLRLSGAAAVAARAAETARAAARTLATPGLDDAAKEAASRRAAGALFASFLRIAVIGVAGLALAAVVVWLGAAAGLYDLGAAITVAGGWPFIAGSTLFGALAWVLSSRIERRTP